MSTSTRSKRRRTRRSGLGRGLLVAALLATLFGIATLRVVIAGEQEIAASTAALRRGDARAATVHARRAAGWYAPGVPHVRVAYDRLRALARAAEEHRRIDIALLAWRGIRSASLESRWLRTPFQTDLELANKQIARLMAHPPRGPAEPPEGAEDFAAELLELLTRHQAPRLPWVVALVASFALGTAGLAYWARQAARAGGRPSWRRARWGAFLTAMAIVLWLVAAWRA